ncbi:Putative major facilitator superfamily, MFS transporter superfamily [Septoria linicola]|uniref:Major facilitator superfamily, MFS transporter superfamily n=1 Tax=Septoria linicola TaxID=215465 RepID=A0A9Q9AEY8_9PEZI|nr:putative major facilitator superfamily, MFS transporter superfamily [Septoria linicola]USW47782.1 Putative major facilitator superfamily, MFS transporter superfamily [Septoria linicola]
MEAKDNDFLSEISPLLSTSVDPSKYRKPVCSPDETRATHGTFDNLHKGPTITEEAVESQSLDERHDEDEGLPEVKKKLKYVFPAIAIGVFLSAADQTLVVSAYGRFGSELNALTSTSWIATSYFMTLTCFQPLFGKLSDLFGRKECLLFGYVNFALGCLACGLARNISQLVIARAWQAIGAAAMSTCVSIIFSDTCTLRGSGQWQGYITIIYAAGASAGAPLGGIAADHIGWRYAFLVQVPLCILACVAVSLTLHLPTGKHTDSLRKRLLRIDLMGATMLISAVFTLLLGFDRGSNDSWSSPVTLSALSSSALLWIAFVVVETRVASEPFAPSRIIFDRTLVACYACNFFSMAGWLSTIFYIPLYFQTAIDATATEAGLLLIPSVITGVLGSVLAGHYMRATGRYYTLTIIAYTTLTIGIIVVFLFSGRLVNNTDAILIGMCLCGFGNGIGITTTLIGLIANASREDQAVCGYGMQLSVPFVREYLRRIGLGMSEEQAMEVAERVRESLAYLESLHPRARLLVESCYARSTNTAFGVQATLVFGAFVSAWFIREKALSK